MTADHRGQVMAPGAGALPPRPTVASPTPPPASGAQPEAVRKVRTYAGLTPGYTRLRLALTNGNITFVDLDLGPEPQLEAAVAQIREAGGCIWKPPFDASWQGGYQAPDIWTAFTAIATMSIMPPLGEST